LSSDKSIALVELGDSHVVCIYPQILFLHQAGYTIHLLTSERLRKQVERFDMVNSFAFFHPGDDFRTHWNCVLDVRKYLVAHRIRTVLFNTAEGNHVRDLCLVAPLGLRFVGILHHTYKLGRSFTQWLISFRVKRYFVLNDYLLDHLPHSTRLRFASYYPIFFPPFERVSLEKKHTEFWVGIPGEVEFRRRDYKGLLASLVRQPAASTMKFLLLGTSRVGSGDGEQFKILVKEAGLESQFVFFEDFLDNNLFYSYIDKCDVVLPLIHPTNSLYSIYQRHQTSGTYIIAFGFAKPMLMHDSFKGVEDFTVSSFFYDDESLVATLNRLASDRSCLEEKRKEIQSQGRFQFEEQCRRFLGFVGEIQ